MKAHECLIYCPEVVLLDDLLHGKTYRTNMHTHAPEGDQSWVSTAIGMDVFLFLFFFFLFFGSFPYLWISYVQLIVTNGLNPGLRGGYKIGVVFCGFRWEHLNMLNLIRQILKNSEPKECPSIVEYEVLTVLIEYL